MTAVPRPDPPHPQQPDTRLQRRLGLVGAVMIGLGAMLGAGIFVVLAPAAAAAGDRLVLAFGLAAFLAWCNATSSARLAARYPSSGGAYVFGRERLGPFWGYLAGWSFVTGKTASCAAIALTFASYTWPGHEHLVAVAAVLAVTALNLTGIEKSAQVSAAIVILVVAVLAALVVAVPLDLGDGPWPSDLDPTVDAQSVARPGATLGGVLEAAGLIFFAFAGYARIATLGEEVRDPERTIPRAISLALGFALFLYATVALAALVVLDVDGLASATAPLVAVSDALGTPGLTRAVTIAAIAATLGSLLSLSLGVSRTTLAMARDRHLPQALSRLSGDRRVPRRAELAVGAAVAALAAVGDVRHVIGFSSFAVLLYYAVANASAWTLTPAAGSRSRTDVAERVIAGTGLAGCLVVASSLPARSVVLGLLVAAVGAVSYAVRRAWPRVRSR
jgi:APA family basic amino acid/polyamine antiporter